MLSSAPDQPWRTPDEWQAAAPRVQGSWWLSWHGWLLQHNAARGTGQTVPARAVPTNPALGDTPGRYVLVRYGD